RCRRRDRGGAMPRRPPPDRGTARDDLGAGLDRRRPGNGSAALAHHGGRGGHRRRCDRDRRDRAVAAPPRERDGPMRRRRLMEPGTLYDRVAQRSAAHVIAGYSTSFGWASRLLDEPVRTHVRSVYALVRVADETVDDPDPDLSSSVREELLTALEAETARGVHSGRSTNLVVHAFAVAARRYG